MIVKRSLIVVFLMVLVGCGEETKPLDPVSSRPMIIVRGELEHTNGFQDDEPVAMIDAELLTKLPTREHGWTSVVSQGVYNPLEVKFETVAIADILSFLGADSEKVEIIYYARDDLVRIDQRQCPVLQRPYFFAFLGEDSRKTEKGCPGLDRHLIINLISPSVEEFSRIWSSSPNYHQYIVFSPTIMDPSFQPREDLEVFPVEQPAVVIHLGEGSFVWRKHPHDLTALTSE